MLRLILFIIFLCAASFGAVWLADNPGEIEFTWLGYEVQTSFIFAAAVILALLIILIIAIELLFFIINIPNKIHQKSQIKTITKTIIALLENDSKSANNGAIKALKLLENDKYGKKLAILLSAQAQAMAQNDIQSAIGYNQLLEDKDTKFIASLGLLKIDERNQDIEQAIIHAKTALKLQPNNKDLITGLLNLYINSCKWADMQLFLQKFSARKWLKIFGDNGLRLHEQLAMALFMRSQNAYDEGNKPLAFEHALAANKLNPALGEAAISACELAMNQGKRGVAADICLRSWKNAPSHELAELYLSLYSDKKQSQKLKRIKKLTAKNPDHPISIELFDAHQRIKLALEDNK